MATSKDLSIWIRFRIGQISSFARPIGFFVASFIFFIAWLRTGDNVLAYAAFLFAISGILYHDYIRTFPEAKDMWRKNYKERIKNAKSNGSK